MRLIDADNLKEGIACHKQWTDQEYETDRQWAVGYNAGIERALFSITYARTIDAVPVVRCKDCWKRGNPHECPMCHEECVGYDWEDGTDDEWWPIDQTEDDGFCYVGEKERSPQ